MKINRRLNKATFEKYAEIHCVNKPIIVTDDEMSAVVNGALGFHSVDAARF